jgi:hypothetical protein
MLSNAPKSYGIDSVAISAAAQSYVQLPNHPCDEVWIGASTNNLSVAQKSIHTKLPLPPFTRGSVVLKVRFVKDARNLRVGS